MCNKCYGSGLNYRELAYGVEVNPCLHCDQYIKDNERKEQWEENLKAKAVEYGYNHY